MITELNTTLNYTLKSTVFCFFSETSKITCPVIDIQMLMSAESQRGFQVGESAMILSSKEVVCFLSDIN